MNNISTKFINFIEDVLTSSLDIISVIFTYETIKNNNFDHINLQTIPFVLFATIVSINVGKRFANLVKID